MRVLIDTHTFLWYVGDISSLSKTALSVLSVPSTEILISSASIWEISIKFAQGRLSIVGGFAYIETDLKNNSIKMLSPTFDHLSVNSQLPFYHKDPFDRMIAAQAISEKIDLVSVDTIFDNYFAPTSSARIW